MTTTTTPCILCGKDSGRSAAEMGAGSALCAACVPVASAARNKERCNCCENVGWFVSWVDYDAPNLERCDACERFASDDAAAAHVRAKTNR